MIHRDGYVVILGVGHSNKDSDNLLFKMSRDMILNIMSLIKNEDEHKDNII